MRTSKVLNNMKLEAFCKSGARILNYVSPKLRKSQDKNEIIVYNIPCLHCATCNVRSKAEEANKGRNDVI